jgi:hypothetical protein
MSPFVRPSSVEHVIKNVRILFYDLWGICIFSSSSWSRGFLCLRPTHPPIHRFPNTNTKYAKSIARMSFFGNLPFGAVLICDAFHSAQWRPVFDRILQTVHPPTHLSTHPPIHPPTHPPTDLSTHPPTYPPTQPSTSISPRHARRDWN